MIQFEEPNLASSDLIALGLMKVGFMPRRRLLGIIIGLLVALSTSHAQAVVGPELVSTVATGSLDSPIGMAFDSNGNLYIADSVNHRVQMVTPAGIVSTVLGTTGANGSGTYDLDRPSSVAVDSSGNLYVADRQNHRIQMLATDGAVSTVLGVTGVPGGGDYDLRTPVSVAIDTDDNLYVADLYNHRVQKLTPAGVASTVSGTTEVPGGGDNQFRSPSGVAVDNAGNVYVADVYNHRIQRIAPDGTATTVAGTNGVSGDAYNHFRSPSGVAVDSLGNLYIADRWNHRVQRLSPDGQLTTTLGTTHVAGSEERDLRAPSGVAVDASGNLYVADTNNDRIQLLTADTIAPTISITAPARGSIVRSGPSSIVRFACSDFGGSQVVSCEGTINLTSVNNGERADVVPSGDLILVVTAIDGQGNRSTAEVPFRLLPPDGTLALEDEFSSMSGTAGSVARLYMSVLGRQPDSDGHDFWVGSIEEGVSLRTTSRLFLGGSEYREIYDDLDDDEFVENLYLNVLNREAELLGAYYWIVRLSQDLSREDVILWFSESPEFKSLTGSS